MVINPCTGRVTFGEDECGPAIPASTETGQLLIGDSSGWWDLSSGVTFLDGGLSINHMASMSEDSGDMILTDSHGGYTLSDLAGGDVEDATANGQIPFGIVGSLWGHTETDEMVWDDINKRSGIGVADPARRQEIRDTAPQLRLSSDGSNCADLYATLNGGFELTTTNQFFRINNRMVIAPPKTLADNVATGVFEVALPNGSMTGGRIDYTITATNGTEQQSSGNCLSWSAVNKAGVITSDITEAGGGLATKVVSASTLDDIWTCVAGTGKITITVNANSGLATPTITIAFTIINNSANTITLL